MSAWLKLHCIFLCNRDMKENRESQDFLQICYLSCKGMIRSASLGKLFDDYSYDQGDLPQIHFQTPLIPMMMDEKKVTAKLIVPSILACLVLAPQCDYDPPRPLSSFELAHQVVVEEVGHRYLGV